MALRAAQQIFVQSIMRSLALLTGAKNLCAIAAFLAAQPLHLCIILYNNVRLKNTSFVGCRRSGN